MGKVNQVDTRTFPEIYQSMNSDEKYNLRQKLAAALMVSEQAISMYGAGKRKPMRILRPVMVKTMKAMGYNIRSEELFGYVQREMYY